MIDESFSHANEILAEALEREPHERPAFLRDACAGDEKLRARIEALIALDDKAASFLETPDIQPTIEPTTDTHAPARIGRYEVLRIIASGGMGTVYEAVQDHPHRLVAIKVLRRGAASSKAMKRFRHEAEILGRLRHANIAQVYEAGSFDDGQGAQPYFAMELVKGRSLIEYVQTKGLETRPRLELFAKVCDAVQYAHHKGVIHRDLKPDNILVDDFGEPKILDFGIARATDSDLQITTLRTDIGQLIGTIPYMSPEQVSGDPQELDMRSDVYSLGVVLYELMCGRLPHDLKERSIPEAVRIIREEDPPPLSSINRVYRGDVETIVAKALAKEKTRRYQSAAELATDVRHYLSDEPIEARPASTFYQLRKFTRRNRALVGGVAVAFAALLLGTVAATWQAVEANRSEKQAVMQAEIAEAVNDFLNQDLLAAAVPSTELGKGIDVLMRDVLDEAAKRIDDTSGVGGRFEDKPLVEASIRQTLGVTYRRLGEFAAAKPHLERARLLRRRELGEEHPDTLTSTGNLAVVYGWLGRKDEAESLHREVLEIRTRVLGKEHPLTLGTMDQLANMYWSTGRSEESDPLYLEVLEIRTRVLGEEHRSTLISMKYVARLHESHGRHGEAELLYVKCYEIMKRVYGKDDPGTLVFMTDLATLYADLGRLDEAEPLFLENIETCKRIYGAEHPLTLWPMNNLAYIYAREGQYEKGEPLARRVLQTYREKYGESHGYTRMAQDTYGAVLLAAGRFEEAEALFRRVIRAAERISEESWNLPMIRSHHGMSLAELGHYQEAEQLLLRAYPPMQYTREAEEIVRYLVMIYEGWGKPEQAAEWRAKLPTEQDAVASDRPADDKPDE